MKVIPSQHIANILKTAEIDTEIRILEQSTRTAQEAASAIGCEVSQIAKSIIFKDKKTSEALLIIACGHHQIDLKKFQQLTSIKTEKADAHFVKDKTGYVIGGVPPFGHKQHIKTFIDEKLLTRNECWAAAGTPHAVMRLNSRDLVKFTKAEIIRIC